MGTTNLLILLGEMIETFLTQPNIFVLVAESMNVEIKFAGEFLPRAVFVCLKPTIGLSFEVQSMQPTTLVLM